MKLRNLGQLALWSAGSFGMTLAIIGPSRLEATSPSVVGDTDPKVMEGTAELRLRFAGRDNQVRFQEAVPGENITVELVAFNPTDTETSVQARVAALKTPEMSRLARISPMPQEIWSQEESISLAPGERKVISVSVKNPGDNKGVLYVSLMSAKTNGPTMLLGRLNLTAGPANMANGGFLLSRRNGNG
jgi:hypothetical protein